MIKWQTKHSALARIRIVRINRDDPEEYLTGYATAPEFIYLSQIGLFCGRMHASKYKIALEDRAAGVGGLSFFCGKPYPGSFLVTLLKVQPENQWVAEDRPFSYMKEIK